MVLEDGTGSGKQAKVNNKNQVSTASVTVDEITHVSSVEEGTYQFHFEVTATASNVFEPIGHIKYTGNNKLQIANMTMSREDVNLSTGSQAVVELMSNTSYTSGGAVLQPINLTIGSSQVVDVELHSGSTALVINDTNKQEILDIAFDSTHTQDFRGALILTKDKEVSIIGKSKNIGDLIHVIVFAYEVKEVI